MRQAVVILFLLALPAIGWGQTVTVRSGEHADFSRLVFRPVAAGDWRLGRVAGGYRLELPGARRGIDLSGTFTRIPRDRLLSLERDGPRRVDLAVRAGAHARAFSMPPDMLIVDIRDGPPAANSPFETVLDRVPPPPVPRLPITLGGVAPDPRAAPLLVPRPPHPGGGDPRPDLFRQLGRAMSQGLLAPAPAGGDAPDRTGPPPSERAVASGAGTAARHLRTDTSIDRALPVGQTSGQHGPQDPPCWPDAVLDLAGWYEDTPLAVQIGRRRSALYDSRDRAQPDAVAALARTYLALGFGAEAAHLVRFFGLQGPEATIWPQIAAILDRGQALDPAPFAGQLACPGASAMWAVLARPALPDEPVDTAAVRRTFSALPAHLRRHLGPGLADRFIGAGDTATALAIRDAALRPGPGGADPGLEMMEAKLALVRGDHASAARRLSDLAESGAPVAAESLALRLDQMRAAGHAPRPEDVLAAESLAFELRGTPMGGRLQAAAIAAHGARGDFARAFALWSEGPPENAVGLADVLIADLAGKGSDAEVLHAVLGQAAGPVLARAGVAARVALGRRLVALELPDAAERLVRDLPPTDSPTMRMLLAELALTRAAPGQALQYLAGLTDPEAATLRARSRALRGDLVGAARAALQGDRPAAAADFAWRARDWDTIRAHGTPVQRRLAETRADAPVSMPSLAGTRALLAQSAQIRALLREIGHAQPDAVQISETDSP
ncbi:hypothetical protein [Rhodovulum adriaticum]|uniref:Uncharacterized protein n=1 Tax=Rhodovulum adriaticum TaxID=35804 RepID=A0A4R2NZD4_RHOAD|nr:hypothetical protein [Rhodovulum adriaticum]MBK1634775.1 hypothetical protein [Rhodovulum adriaticum]TCP27650.1 hypothetical protein EV656_101559 [Rhodovulum adriaticum]